MLQSRVHGTIDMKSGIPNIFVTNEKTLKINGLGDTAILYIFLYNFDNF